MSIYDAAMKYAETGTPLVLLVGKEYGTGSSRDWAAKGAALLGVKAVIAESYERIHRSNLVGMGVLPLAFEAGKSAESLGLTGREVIAITGIDRGLVPGGKRHGHRHRSRHEEGHHFPGDRPAQFTGGSGVSGARRDLAAGAADVRTPEVSQPPRSPMLAGARA